MRLKRFCGAPAAAFIRRLSMDQKPSDPVGRLDLPSPSSLGKIPSAGKG